MLPKTVCFVTVQRCRSWGAQSAWCPQPHNWGAVLPQSSGFAAYEEGKQLRSAAIVHSIGLLKLSVLSFRKGFQLICYI